MSILQFYTDGACSGNPGPGGWACIEPIDESICVVTSNRNVHTTNNIMEMSAVLEALLSIGFKSADEIEQFDRAIIYTDSSYVVNCFRDKWYEKWEHNGWRTSKNEPVKNKELWQDILAAYRQANKLLPTTLVYVKGHDTNYYNNLADIYAVAARKGEGYNHEIIYRSDIQ